MVKAGCQAEGVQLHRFFAWKDVKLREKAPFIVQADDCIVSEGRTKGSVSVTENEILLHPETMSDAGSMSWDLRFKKELAFNVGYGASAPLRRAEAFEMYWHAEGMKTTYAGQVVFNGVRYTVTPETSFGYADKNWGRNFTSPWVWLSSNSLKSRLTGERLKNSAFDVGGGRPKVYFVPLERKLLGAFYYEGKEYEYNFSKPWTLPRTKFVCKDKGDRIYWHVRQENRTSVMDTQLVCKKSELIFMNYESPDGKKRHNRLWNGGTGRGRIRLYEKAREGLLLIDDIDVTRAGCEYGEY